MSVTLRNLGWAVGLPVLLLSVVALVTGFADSLFFPPLTEVLAAFGPTWDGERVLGDVVPSLSRLLIGLGIAILAAIGLGTILGMSPRLYLLADPVIAYVRAIPAPATLPMFLMVFGIGDLTKIATIALGTTWPMLLNTIDGVRGVPTVQRETMRLLGLPLAQRWWLSFRHASPQFFAGLRQAVSLAIVLMVISEMVMSSDGIGYTIIQFQRQFSITRMWTGILLLGVLGVFAAWAAARIERSATRWHVGLTRQKEFIR